MGTTGTQLGVRMFSSVSIKINLNVLGENPIKGSDFKYTIKLVLGKTTTKDWEVQLSGARKEQIRLCLVVTKFQICKMKQVLEMDSSCNDYMNALNTVALPLSVRVYSQTTS